MIEAIVWMIYIVFCSILALVVVAISLGLGVGSMWLLSRIYERFETHEQS